MHDLKIGKREKKKFQQKKAILDAFLRAMTTKELYEIKVEDICMEVGLSKVTFFKYFSTKEAVIQFYVQLWQYDMAYQARKTEEYGKSAVYRIFDSISDHPAGNSVMNAIIQYFTKDPDNPMDVIEPYELCLYNKDAYHMGIRPEDLPKLFANAISRSGYREQEISQKVNLLIIGFYGIPVIHHRLSSISLKTQYRNYVDDVLKDIC